MSGSKLCPNTWLVIRFSRGKKTREEERREEKRREAFRVDIDELELCMTQGSPSGKPSGLFREN